jgi:hypothetical protein
MYSCICHFRLVECLGHLRSLVVVHKDTCFDAENLFEIVVAARGNSALLFELSDAESKIVDTLLIKVEELKASTEEAGAETEIRSFLKNVGSIQQVLEYGSKIRYTTNSSSYGCNRVSTAIGRRIDAKGAGKGGDRRRSSQRENVGIARVTTRIAQSGKLLLLEDAVVGNYHTAYSVYMMA